MKKEASKELKVVNIGLLRFYESLKTQGVRVVQVKWRPPVKRSEDIDSLLDKFL